MCMWNGFRVDTLTLSSLPRVSIHTRAISCFLPALRREAGLKYIRLCSQSATCIISNFYILKKKAGDVMSKGEWLLCPVCKGKTRTRIRGDTTLTNFPLFCPKCGQETLVNVRQAKMVIIKEPDAKGA